MTNTKPEVKRSRDDIWMPFYVGDYLADTNRLTTEQHGAYLLLILDYWKSGPIPDDDGVLARITRLSNDSWARSRSVLVAFFKHVDGHLTHKRIDKEKEKARSLADKHHDRAQKAATARWEAERARSSSGSEDATSNATSNSQALLDECPEQCLSDAIYSHSHSHSHSHLKSNTPSQGEDSKPLGVVNPETGEILNPETDAVNQTQADCTVMAIAARETRVCDRGTFKPMHTHVTSDNFQQQGVEQSVKQSADGWK